MSVKRPVKDAVSAGGVIWRRNHGRVEVVVCGRLHGDGMVWALPKGAPDEGEAIEQAAVREAEEETGLKVEPGAKVGSIDYWFVDDGYRYHKYVHHWLMTPTGGDLAEHDFEFDEVKWLPADEARSLLTYGNEKVLVENAVRMIEEASS